MDNINRTFLYFMILLVCLLSSQNIFADGSKDLHPSTTPATKSGAVPVRALLYSSAPSSANSQYYVFPNHGVHYVYAQPGERITLASSAQGSGSARIRMYAPDGTEVINANSGGQITNRTAELAGPQRFGQTGGNRYTPIYYQVPANKGGVYRVEFRGRTDGVPTTRIAYTTDWTQSTQGNNGIIAWDVSVINTNNTAFVSGRVYTTILNLANGTTNPDTSGFYGMVYVRTRDGYTYRVNNNGSNGICYSFFVNNNGFLNTNGSPKYKSLNYLAGNSDVQNPDYADTDKQVTHKMFYTTPASDLPESAQVTLRTIPSDNASSNTSTISTWLKNEVKVPKVETVKLIGTDGIEGQVSNKGGYIKFLAGSQGNYRITITSVDPAKPFNQRILTGASFAGENAILWDGKAGSITDPTQPGLPLPAGSVPVEVTVQLQGAEVHFPFFDMEYNKNGIVIELLDHETDLSTVKSNIVYWNDADVNNGTTGNNAPRGRYSDPKNNSHLPPVNSSGTNSTENGHIWGVGATGTSGQFGDSKSIDTWTFIKGEEESSVADVAVSIADLKVTDLKVNGANGAAVRLGDEITYTVKVKNGEPGDGGCFVKGATFTFTLPEGLTGTGTPVFDGNGCGSQDVVVSYDAIKRQYTSKLDLPNGCEITYTFKATIGVTAKPGYLRADATILRPNDVTDPDATNISDPLNPLAPTDQNPFDLDIDAYYFPPTDPYFECANNFPSGNPQRGICNNIRDIRINLIRRSDLAIEKTVSSSKPKVGDIVTFTLKVTNNGPHTAVNILITDIVPNGYTIGTINDGGINTNGTIKWIIASLAKDASNSVSFTVTVLASGDYLNTATVTGDGEDPNPDNNRDTERVSLNNYWHGTIDNDWSEDGNWTANYVPGPGEDVEFATSANNNGNPADKDLHLDKDRIIGDLINASDKNLLVTTGNELIINGEVKDGNPVTGTIIVKSATDEASGTLLFTDPSKNQQVNATVEFYNKAYECATCGFYRKQWQYFGIPVQSSGFPYLNPQVETVNQWVEPFNGNKWQPAPYTPDTDLKAFKGYEMTSSSNVLPTHIYSFVGSLNVGDANVSLTRSVNVNYPGMNLIGNSFTAAIPITSSAINLGGVTLNDNTAYLFNTGTRDQWRKLDGGAVMGVAAGQYQAVPFNLSGQAGIPDRILSMHTFMLNVTTPGNIILKYDELTKNELNSSTIMPWKSAELRSSTTTELPHIVMDVIAEGSADRVWLFEQADATTGFDNGWDGYKIKEGEIIQTYVSGSDQSDYQIATVSEIEGTTIAVKSALSESYTINFSVTPDVEHRKLYLKNLVTGRYYPIVNNEKYTIARSASSGIDRFLVTASSSTITDDALASLLTIYVLNNIITVNNQTEEDCIATVYDMMGRTVANKQVHKNEITEFTELSYGRTGIYIVKVEGKSKSVNKTDRVLLK